MWQVMSCPGWLWELPTAAGSQRDRTDLWAAGLWVDGGGCSQGVPAAVPHLWLLEGWAGDGGERPDSLPATKMCWAGQWTVCVTQWDASVPLLASAIRTDAVRGKWCNKST